MVEEDLGEATIVYEGPDGDTVEKTVQNEHVAYFQDHWILRTGEDDRGRDEVRRIPLQRVYHVERSVEEFEEEVATLRDQVQSLADDLRSKVLGGSGGPSGTGSGSRSGAGSGSGSGGGRGSRDQPHEIEIESGGGGEGEGGGDEATGGDGSGRSGPSS